MGSSNNINSVGFAQDEIFDNMAGGRNSNGSNNNSAGAKGITQSSLGGLNYSGDWFENLKGQGSYNFFNSTSNNYSKSNQVSFLPMGNIATSSDIKTRNESTGSNANFELEYEIDPTTELIISPKINQSYSNRNLSSSNFSTDENGNSLNESNTKSYSKMSNTSFGNRINFNKAFEKENRNFSLVFDHNYSSTSNEVQNLSRTFFIRISHQMMIETRRV